MTDLRSSVRCTIADAVGYVATETDLDEATEAAVGAVADWFAERASPTLDGDPFILAADWAATSLRQELAP